MSKLDVGYEAYCDRCHHLVEEPSIACPCGGEVHFRYTTGWRPEQHVRSMWRYRSRLPVSGGDAITLGEGGTPLIASARLFAGRTVFLKDETRNPTGSMKDRAMSVAFSKAIELDRRRSIILSAGGSGIAASAYAARADVVNFVVVPEDVPTPRLLLSALTGSVLVRVKGNVEHVLAIVEAARASGSFYEVSTYRKGNPYQAEAAKTIAYEVFEAMQGAPDAFVIPVGGGGTLAGIHRGFVDLLEAGLIRRVPRLIGVQNVNFAALRLALDEDVEGEDGLRRLASRIDSNLPTETGGLRHAYPPDGAAALSSVRQSNGDVVTVTDDEALAWRRRLALTEGLLAEPSSTAALAATEKLIARGAVAQGDRVVALLTGAAWRDLVRLSEEVPVEAATVDTDPTRALDQLIQLGEHAES